MGEMYGRRCPGEIIPYGVEGFPGNFSEEFVRGKLSVGPGPVDPHRLADTQTDSF